MFNIQNSVQAVLTAEAVLASKSLTHDERCSFLANLRDTITVIPGLPDHAEMARNVITRILDSEQRTQPTAPKQGRQAEGVQEPTEVAAGRAEEGTEAPKGATEGGQDAAEDARRADRPKSRKSKGSHAPAAAEAPEA